ncbi:hypothetical protein FA95DRAFT_1608349 [Auriscalpium vulgare]|uniref:Uncharacterized protein n=1 Tax=Auriscalpium vulgare TaxID=40419 RepID=A0ACB8RKU2_9AGAM|nr:hypothetical protein FA95DRAFT_1608349 [Auriscalpium vulgare]
MDFLQLDDLLPGVHEPFAELLEPSDARPSPPRRHSASTPTAFASGSEQPVRAPSVPPGVSSPAEPPEAASRSAPHPDVPFHSVPLGRPPSSTHPDPPRLAPPPSISPLREFSDFDYDYAAAGAAASTGAASGTSTGTPTPFVFPRSPPGRPPSAASIPNAFASGSERSIGAPSVPLGLSSPAEPPEAPRPDFLFHSLPLGVPPSSTHPVVPVDQHPDPPQRLSAVAPPPSIAFGAAPDAYYAASGSAPAFVAQSPPQGRPRSFTHPFVPAQEQAGPPQRLGAVSAQPLIAPPRLFGAAPDAYYAASGSAPAAPAAFVSQSRPRSFTHPFVPAHQHPEPPRRLSASYRAGELVRAPYPASIYDALQTPVPLTTVTAPTPPLPAPPVAGPVPVFAPVHSTPSSPRSRQSKWSFLGDVRTRAKEAKARGSEVKQKQKEQRALQRGQQVAVSHWRGVWKAVLERIAVMTSVARGSRQTTQTTNASSLLATPSPTGRQVHGHATRAAPPSSLHSRVHLRSGSHSSNASQLHSVPRWSPGLDISHEDALPFPARAPIPPPFVQQDQPPVTHPFPPTVPPIFPPAVPGQVTLHNDIAYNQLGRRRLDWDMRCPAATAVRPHPDFASGPPIQLPLGFFDLPATNPPTQSMSISRIAQEDYTDFPWPIECTADDERGVTIGGVLIGVSQNLEQWMTSPEHRLVPRVRRERVEAASVERVEEALRHSQPVDSGVRRVDYLEEHHYFLGLSQEPVRNDWTLHVGPALRSPLPSQAFDQQAGSALGYLPSGTAPAHDVGALL